MANLLVLRTCNANGTSHYDGKFKWPTSGPVECQDWDPSPVCGGGLHGLLMGFGNAGHLSSDKDAIWQVISVNPDDLVKIDVEKVKFRRGVVVYSGARVGALSMVLHDKQRLADLINIEGKTTGKYAHAATTGKYAHAATTGKSAHAATTGWYAHAATTGEYAHAAVQGPQSIAVTCGLNGEVKGAENCVIAASYWDEKSNRIRLLVGHIGEDGLKPNTAYSVHVYKNGHAKWKEVK